MTSKPPKRTARDGVDRCGRTPLHNAAVDGNAAEVTRLLAIGITPNAQDDDGWTALHFAAQANCAECVARLIRAGSDVSLADAFGNTALLRAVFASKGDGAVILLLREAGGDPLAKNRHGVSPVSLARTIANFDVARFFSDVDAD